MSEYDSIIPTNDRSIHDRIGGYGFDAASWNEGNGGAGTSAGKFVGKPLFNSDLYYPPFAEWRRAGGSVVGLMSPAKVYDMPVNTTLRIDFPSDSMSSAPADGTVEIAQQPVFRLMGSYRATLTFLKNKRLLIRSGSNRSQTKINVHLG